MIELIASEGSDCRTRNVGLYNAETHIKANDRLANEARCLLAWRNDGSEREPTGWDGERLLFGKDIGDAEPVKVVWE